MALDEDIRTALLTLASVTARCGTGSAARIRTDNLEPADKDQITSTQDAIIIQVDSETPLNSLDGKGGRRMASFVLVCRAVSRKRARALAEAVRTNNTNPGTGLAGYSSSTLDMWLEDIQMSLTEKGDGSKAWWYDVNLDFMATFAETT